MKPGDVLLTTMPQADGTQKARPVLLLCQVPPFNDFLVCGITTWLDNAVAQLDEVVTPSDEVFAAERFTVMSTRSGSAEWGAGRSTIPALALRACMGRGIGA
jgi:hypothetical protein